MIGGIPAMMNNLQKELLSVIDRSNLEIRQLSFSTKFGTLCFNMPGQQKWRGNTGGDGSYGSYGGSSNSGGGRK